MENKGIPFKDVTDVIAKLPRASVMRVMFEMLVLTGCRIAALDRMKISQIHEGMIHWHEGKRTSGMRRERLPSWYWKEIEEYRRQTGVSSDRLFGINAENFSKRFRKNVRPLVGGNWTKKEPAIYASYTRMEYVLQVKGLRKNYQTLEFARQLDKWKDAGVALEFTSKKMKHSSARITAYHYIQNFDTIDATKHSHRNMGEIIRGGRMQESLLEYDGKE